MKKVEFKKSLKFLYRKLKGIFYNETIKTEKTRIQNSHIKGGKMMRKKRLAVGILTMAMATAVMAPTALSAKAAAAPQGIRIEGAKTVRVGKTIELDTEIYPDDDMVNSWNIVWESNKPSVAKVLYKNGDDTKIQGKKTGTAKITVRIKGTNLKATYKVNVQKAVSTSTQASSDKNKIKKYKKKIRNIRNNIKNLTVPTDPTERRTKYLVWEKKLKNVENKLDVINDRWDDRYGTTARQMETKVERAENLLESAEDYLDLKFGYYDD